MGSRHRVRPPNRQVSVRESGDVDVREELRRERLTNAMLSESVFDLERQLLDPGWLRLQAQSLIEFSPAGMIRIRALCRIYFLKNPLIRRGLLLRSSYVFGQGVEVEARANGKSKDNPNEQDVNAVVQAFLQDPHNQRAVTGSAARERLERTLGTDGEVFLACFTNPRTGRVQVRYVVADEISDVVTNPDDQSEPWFYRRRWAQKILDEKTGEVTTQVTQERLYPAMGYTPRVKLPAMGGVEVAWDSPMLHIRVNEPLGWQRGVPDAYAALDWARAYKSFLEDWANLMKSLARFAWKLTAKGQAAGAARTKLAAAPGVDPITRAPLGAGATSILPPDAELEAIPKTGATIDAESGRPIAMMVAAALGVPVTMLLADPGQTGARATAETLDQPTELEMAARQSVWVDAYQRLCGYVITESVRAPQGVLKGKVTVDPYDSRETVELLGNTPDTVDVSFPDLDDVPPNVLVNAIVQADSTRTVPPEIVLRELLTALRIRHVDEVIDAMMDDDGNFKWPNAGPYLLGAQADDIAAAGGDAATAGTGPMGGPADSPPPAADAGKVSSAPTG